MAVEGRSAGAELLLEDIQRMTPGYQGQVDILALGMVGDGRIPRDSSGISGQWPVVS